MSFSQRLVQAIRIGAAPLRLSSARIGLPLGTHDRRLGSLAGRHRGRRGFVLGNGPSLAVGDLDRLGEEITFASNKIYLAFGDTSWRPTYYSVIDALVAENNRQEIRRLTDLDHIHSEHVRRELGDDQGFLYIDHRPSPRWLHGELPGFSTNLFAGAHGGWTVLYLQLQLAFFLGIREVYLLGLDFSFDVPKGSSTGGSTRHGDQVLESQGEVNHFHPDYRKPGETWTVPRLEEQKRAFRSALRAFERVGGTLINASRQTRLDVLPRGNLDEVLAERR